MNNAATNLPEVYEFAAVKALADTLNAKGYKSALNENISGFRQKSALIWSNRSVKVVEIQHLGIEIFALPSGELVRFFSGRKMSHDYYDTARNPERAEKVMIENITHLSERYETMRAERAAAREQGHGLQKGDVMKCSFGYDMTLVHYYEIVGLLGKASVIVREISQERSGDGFSGRCVPMPGKYIGEPQKYRVGRNNSIKFSDCQRAYKVEPKIVAGAKIYDSTYYNHMD